MGDKDEWIGSEWRFTELGATGKGRDAVRQCAKISNQSSHDRGWGGWDRDGDTTSQSSIHSPLFATPRPRPQATHVQATPAPSCIASIRMREPSDAPRFNSGRVGGGPVGGGEWE